MLRIVLLISLLLLLLGLIWWVLDRLIRWSMPSQRNLRQVADQLRQNLQARVRSGHNHIDIILADMTCQVEPRGLSFVSADPRKKDANSLVVQTRWPTSRDFVMICHPSDHLIADRWQTRAAPPGQPVENRSAWGADRVSVRSNDWAMARRVLATDFLGPLRQLKSLHQSTETFLVISDGYLRVFIYPWYDHAGLVFEQIRHAVRALQLCLITGSHEITFVPHSASAAAVPLKCPVCNDSLAEEIKICQRCQTPHCRDCWEYNQHCGAFSCGHLLANDYRNSHHQAASEAIRYD